MSLLLNALQIKNGAGKSRFNTNTIAFTQPTQFLSRKEKTEEWGASMLDWLEWQGMQQLEKTSKTMLKDYKLSAGLIDRSDYIVDEDNEVSDLINELSKEDAGALELKFFPLVPNVIDLMMGEFIKRSDKIVYQGVDDKSYNEKVTAKGEEIEHILVRQAEMRYAQKLIDAGVDPDDPQVQQAMSPEALKSLPEVEQFYAKDYLSLTEQWAHHQHRADVERFHMQELEQTAYRDMLISDKEFWHFNMMEDDYEVELWNPLLTFYHKSPGTRYISQGNYAGKFDIMSVSDVIDRYGWQMNEDQLLSLETIHPLEGMPYLKAGQVQNDGSFYDSTKSHAYNTNMPSLAMRQYTALTGFNRNDGDWLEQIINSDDPVDSVFTGNHDMLRVMTVYWKSQRKLYALTSIDDRGSVETAIVDEEFKVTNAPMYNTMLNPQKSTQNLIYGQHLEPLYINETWGGVKISNNRALTGYNRTGGPATRQNVDDLITPIYLNVKPLKFQFRGDYSLYGCKLPVEGFRCSDRNTKSVSFIQRLKPYQVGFNLVNNQISDLLIDELGTIIVFDQNSLPKHSMGEDWGRGNLDKAYVAMKNLKMLPLDTTLTNTESATNFSHYQVMNMEETNRLLGRIQYANYFKQQLFEAVGISPQRLGNVNAQETAEGVEQATNNSYTQTEIYFVQHTNYLMPRVHEMRTDLAQFYHSTNPSVRLQYITSEDEKINFEINGTTLLGRDINVTCSAKPNTRALLEKLTQLALSNNTSGASIYDLGSMIKASHSGSLAEMNNVLKAVENKMDRQRQEDAANNQQLEETRQKGETERYQMELDNENEQRRLDRENNIEVAEVRASSLMGAQDLDANGENDYMDYIEKRNQNEQNNQLKREGMMQQDRQHQQNAQLKREELSSRERIANTSLAVARTNKNRFDGKKPTSKSKK